MSTKLNKRERKAQQLLVHYITCEKLGRLLGMTNPDGKKISVGLWKAEKAGQKRAVAMCNDENYRDEIVDKLRILQTVGDTLGGKLPPGFFINSDPRGYALKIDDASPMREQLLTIGMQRDMGGYFILSPDITGD